MATEPVTCSCPPALTEDELEAALSGVGDAAVEAHLVQCAYCSARLAAMQRFERTLQVRLARRGCPDVSALGNYVIDLLDIEDKRRLEAHLATCVRCAEELRIMRVALLDQTATRRPDAESESASEWLGRLTVGLRRRIATILPLEPRLALRGNNRTLRILAATVHERIFLETAQHSGRRQLTGQVLAQDSVVWDGAIVEVYHGDELAAVSVLDGMGEFACDGLTAPHMRVMITAIDGQQIVIPDLRFDS